MKKCTKPSSYIFHHRPTNKLPDQLHFVKCFRLKENPFSNRFPLYSQTIPKYHIEFSTKKKRAKKAEVEVDNQISLDYTLLISTQASFFGRSWALEKI